MSLSFYLELLTSSAFSLELWFVDGSVTELELATDDAELRLPVRCPLLE